MTTYTKFNEIKTAYLSSLQTISKSNATYDKYSTVINDFAKWLENNDSNEQEITSVMILAYSKAVKERGIKSNTVRDYLIILHSFFEWCNAHKFYSEQPILKRDIPKLEKVEYDLLNEKQIKQLKSEVLTTKCVHKNTALRNRTMVTLLLQSGLRISECVNLRIGELNLEKHTVCVKHGKGGKLRYTTLPTLSAQLIAEYLNERFKGQRIDENALLFANEQGKPYSRQNLTTVVRRYIKNLCGKDYIGAHDLRHAFASNLITKDVPIAKISSLLGHSSWTTTAIYAEHLCPNRIAEEVNAVI